MTAKIKKENNAIEFVDVLPDKPRTTRRSPLEDFAKQLRANTGRWARIERKDSLSASAMVSRINKDRVAALPANEFRATHRGSVTYVKHDPEAAAAALAAQDDSDGYDDSFDEASA